MNEANWWIRFIVAVLATWRVTHLFAKEDGPGDLIARFRAHLGQTWAGRLMDCFYCLSLWMAVPAAFYVSRGLVLWLFSWFALSGAACLLERLEREPDFVQSVLPSIQGEDHHVLRPETIGATGANSVTDDTSYSTEI